ncbi:MAG: glutamate synthase large subunit [Candidatus Schekmanbacteria bacterium]|nr:glutamate synthase large subunit [Candidatus Schekmanbacteria bacterium]
MNRMRIRPDRWGLYEPQTEKEACGVGFVAQINGVKSREIVEEGLEILMRLSHRGACGCDPETGDGAGILMQLPERFFRREAARLGLALPKRQPFAVGQVFFPPDPSRRRAIERVIKEVVEQEGQKLLGWREVPIREGQLGRIAREVMPAIRQVFIQRRRVVPSAFERKLYVIRKLVGHRVRNEGLDPDLRFHIASLSAETIVYKGLLLPRQLPLFYTDLQDPEMVSAIALVHSRFSTNTFPTWDLAQPFRHIAHNGEINTLQGNRNWMNARRSLLESAKFFGSLERLFPIIVPNRSDSAQFDNMLELLHLGGRSLPHAIMMMIPEAWEKHPLVDEDRKAFYEYASKLLEPWDGPAAIAFTDGHLIGATLDRNGLRPARYIITEDDRVIMASEVGVIDVPPEQIKRKGRLQPGRMLLVDTSEGRIIDDGEVKHEMATRWPYAKWLRKNVCKLADLPAHLPSRKRLAGEELRRLQLAFGYSEEDINLLIKPMAETGEEPIGSMGRDTPLAALSDQAPPLFHYFHQLFAQVTNPPIDPIRESLVMSLRMSLGPDGNTFEETPEQCHCLEIESPVLTNEQLEQIREIHEGDFEPKTLSMLYENRGEPGQLESAVEGLCRAVVEAIDEGANILILSDRGVDTRRRAIPSLLAVSAVHHHLVREGTRMQAGLVVEAADIREVHHFAVLVGYGAAAVNPYLAMDTIADLALHGEISHAPKMAVAKYVEAVNKGLLKTISKMGISTLHSYCGGQIFEIVGINRDVVDRYFSGTASRIEGIGLQELGREVEERHRRGFGTVHLSNNGKLPAGGQYQWRREGEYHRWNPSTIAKLQLATRTCDPVEFAAFQRLADDEPGRLATLRGMLEFDFENVPHVDIEEVEPATSIVRRFSTGAMSFGSISAEAHQTLAIAMNRLGGRSNSGEGGEEAERYTPLPDGDSRRSAIKQVASGRFGATIEYLVNADELQIKIAQGAKPGEGGQLPGHKVDERIARVRHSTPGVSLISPPPHHDIYSIEDLAQLIYDLKVANDRARISVKLVSEVGVGTIAAGVAKAGAGCVVVSGASGGTGASPLSSIKHAGLPWELGIAETHQVLVQNDLRGKVRLQTDGGVRTAKDVVVAALLGAEELAFGTTSLIVEGCIMLRKCHQNTCSVGVATQDPELRKRFAGKPEYLINYFLMLAEEVRALLARLGFRSFDEAVGRVDRLRQRRDVTHWKAKSIDLSQLLAEPQVPYSFARRCVLPQESPLSSHLDRTAILPRIDAALDGQVKARLELPITNRDRTVGTMVSSVIARRYGARGLPDDSIHVKLNGSAGQSFGAFLARGVTLELEGDANDYLGKGCSGGRIIVYPPKTSAFVAEENIIIGNVVLYGATDGELYVRGRAGERFAVRNSGARAVIEGVGDHGCEYMTGGVVVVLGPTGRNFAAGMSGGMAFVLDDDGLFGQRCNLGMVDLEVLVDQADHDLVYQLVAEHVALTGSPVGQRILDNWIVEVPRFVKVMPREYKRVLQDQRAARRQQAAARSRSAVTAPIPASGGGV